MSKDSQVIELQEIYHEMDTEGKKKMVTAAEELLNVQKTLGNMQFLVRDGVQAQEETGERNAVINREFGTRRIAGVMGYILTGLLLFLAACVFWITLINPALLVLGDTPLVMLRIIITAMCGIFSIGAGLMWFILRKFTIPWMFLAIGAGILCVEPGIITDLIGISIVALIVTIQVIHIKREKTLVAV